MGLPFKRLLIVVLFLSCVVPVFSFQPSGGVLSLDGVDDYAILPFAENGYLFPENTREFTVEMWFYPEAGPNRAGSNIIFSQQVYFGMTSNHEKCKGDENELCCYGGVYLDGEKTHGVAGFYMSIERNRWNYLAIMYKDSTLGRASNDWIYRGSKFGVLDRVSMAVRGRPEDFFVGGYAQELVLFRGALPIFRFHGAIDAIRFSKVARYDLPDIPGVKEPFEPPHRLSLDRHTLALWNFDEPEGVDRFQDASKDKKMLIGMNGATINRALAVHPESTSLTTTWGHLKPSSP